MAPKALAPEISTWPEDNPQLIGCRCGDCGATVFPAQDHCPRCSGPNMGEVLLPRRGTVYVCAQDRGGATGPSGAERLLCHANR